MSEPLSDRPRLGVELRIMGALGVLWLGALVHGLAWAGQVATLDVRTVVLLVLAQVVALAVVSGRAVLDLPAVRWPRPMRRQASPWWLAIAGFPSLAVVPVLFWRDARARGREPTPELGTEAFARLVAFPRMLGLRLVLWSGAAWLVGAIVLGARPEPTHDVVLALVLLWLGSLLALAVLAKAWTAALLRPECLSAPWPAAPLHHRTDLRLRLFSAAAIATLGLVTAVLAGGYVWLETVTPWPGAQGWFSLRDGVVHVREHEALIVGGIVTFAAALGALAYLARDTARDVARARAQVDAVAKGEAPPPLTEGAFASAELRELVQSVDRLVSRITDANVAKYVAIERAKEADRLKSQFLANMSHDLRSPLNSVIGFSELLITGIDGELTGEQRDMVAIIHQSGRDLLQQIDDILDTAKIEAGRLELHPEPTPPAALVTKGIQNARKRRPGALEIALDVAPGLPPAFVDPYRTVQAIENVLVFASERMEAGSIEVTVRAGHSGRRKTIAIGVHTPVRPASAEQLAKARRGFHRIPGHKGLGLGLPIAGSIVELQGGSVSIEDLGEGMVFTLHLRALETRRASTRGSRAEEAEA